jgi:lysine 6-dehydrogenase
MKKITVLGGGLVGRTIASDIQQSIADVKVLDSRELHLGVPSFVVDLSQDFTEHIQDADLVVNALPGFLGYSALQTIIRAKKHCVDISFFEEDPFTLDALAKENGVIVAVDCGVAPGMCNMILGYESTRFKVSDYVCTVGGLPVKRTLPFQYKAPYSPSDVIEFYMRPARIKVNGKTMIVPALSDIFLEETAVGTLQSFNTDGLRTLLTTMP